MLVLSLSRDVQYSGSIDREKYRRDLQDVVAILPLFPNLTSIDIASYILNFPHNLLDYRAFLPQRVKNVRIGGHWAKYYDDIEPQQLLWLMHPFSASSEITLTRFFFQLPSVIASTHAFPNFSVLDSLSLRDNFNTDLFLSTLQSLSGCFPALRRLEIGFITLRGQRKAWDIVNTFSGQLIYLGLQRSKNIDEDDIPCRCRCCLQVLGNLLSTSVDSISRLGASAPATPDDFTLYLLPKVLGLSAYITGMGTRAVDCASLAPTIALQHRV